MMILPHHTHATTTLGWAIQEEIYWKLKSFILSTTNKTLPRYHSPFYMLCRKILKYYSVSFIRYISGETTSDNFGKKSSQFECVCIFECICNPTVSQNWSTQGSPSADFLCWPHFSFKFQSIIIPLLLSILLLLPYTIVATRILLRRHVITGQETKKGLAKKTRNSRKEENMNLEGDTEREWINKNDTLWWCTHVIQGRKRRKLKQKKMIEQQVEFNGWPRDFAGRRRRPWDSRTVRCFVCWSHSWPPIRWWKS